MPRRRLEENQLPTQDAHDLLRAMVAKVGQNETARRLARTQPTIRAWLDGGRIPEPVHAWLLRAACATRAPASVALQSSPWHYPRARGNYSKRHRETQLAIIEQTVQAEAVAELDPLDPYE